MANSYRHPPLLAKMAASLQTFSHNRLILGYGAGWEQLEYAAYGYDFPPTKVRIEQMVEGIEVMRALWTQAPANYEGRWYQLRDAYGSAAARSAADPDDRWRRREIPPPSGRATRRLVERLSPHTGHDRAPSSTSCARTAPRSVATSTRSGRPTPSRRTSPRPGPRHGSGPARSSTPRSRRSRATRPRLIDYIRAFSDLGIDLFQLVFAGFPETDDIELFVDKVLPAFR